MMISFLVFQSRVSCSVACNGWIHVAGFLKRSEEGMIEIPDTFLTVEGNGSRKGR